MIVLVIALTVVVALLTVLVAGLLRSHASILRRLAELDGGTEASAPIRTVPGVPEPLTDPVRGAPAADLVGRGLVDDQVVIRAGGVDHDTVLVFLSTGCATCATFWRDLAYPEKLALPDNTRMIIVTKGIEQESVAEVAALAPAGADVVMSSAAWTDYRVPGSPYVVAVNGPAGRISGEGTGLSWAQVARLLAQATGDMSYLSDAKRAPKPASGADRERRVDRELLAAGILPGDLSLYPAIDGAGAPAGTETMGERR